MKGDQVTLFDKNVGFTHVILPRNPISTNFGAGPWEVQVAEQVNEMIKKNGALKVLNFLCIVNSDEVIKTMERLGNL